MSQEQPKLTKEQVQRYLKGEPVLEYGYEENFLGALATEWLDQRRVLEQIAEQRSRRYNMHGDPTDLICVWCEETDPDHVDACPTGLAREVLS